MIVNRIGNYVKIVLKVAEVNFVFLFVFCKVENFLVLYILVIIIIKVVIL